MGAGEGHSRVGPLPGGLTERIERAVEVLRRHPVRLAYLFGSAAREPSRAGDVDIAVLPGEGFSYAELYADLSLALGTDRLDLVDLRLAPVYLQVEIISQGRCLLASSEEERARFEAGRMAQWLEERANLAKLLGEGRGMELRPEFVARAMAELERVAQELEKYVGTTADEMRASLSLRWTIERGLLAGLTLIFPRRGAHPEAGLREGGGDIRGAPLGTEGAGVISDELYKSLRGAGGFRNVLVHEYVEVDLEEVASVLDKGPRFSGGSGRRS